MIHSPNTQATEFRFPSAHVVAERGEPIGPAPSALPVGLLNRSPAQKSQLVEGMTDVAALIALEQRPSGAFASNEIDVLHRTVRRYDEVFATGLIASMMAELPRQPLAVDVAENATRWLDAQRGADHLWAFHGPFGRFPDDVDDTAVGLAAMLKLGQAERSEVDVIHEHFSRDKSGLFGTWKTDAGRTQTFDATANAHLLLLLSESGASVASLESRLLENLPAGRVPLASPYYSSRLPLLVAIYQHLRSKPGTEVRSAGLLKEIAGLLGDLLSRECGSAGIAHAYEPASMFAITRLSLYRRRSLQVFYECRPLRLAYFYWFLAARLSLIE